MSLKELDKKKLLAPFLGNTLKFIPGQDPLGLLNTGERTFDLLLPCMSNVTQRIRYYSFYAWFMEVYAREMGYESKEEQRKYLRRSEYLIALVYAHQGWAGVAGINKAKEIYSAESISFDLRDGTGEAKGSGTGYWKNKGGIFGQNYVSPMMQAGLIQRRNPEEMLYMRTEFSSSTGISGHQLAMAFRDNIGTSAENHFIRLIQDGHIEQRDLKRLSVAFDMNIIPPDTNEHQLLWTFLTGPDFPRSSNTSWLRKCTIRLLLQHIREKGPLSKALDFTLIAYSQKGFTGNDLEESYTLWYYFQLEQFWHMVCTGCLKAFLDYLHLTSGGSWRDETALIKDIAQKVEEHLFLNEAVTAETCFKNVAVSGKEEHLLAENIHSRDAISSIGSAILLLRKLMATNQNHLTRLEYLAKRYNIFSTSGFIHSIKEITDLQREDLQSFVFKFLKKHIVLRHQWVAISKMYETVSTEKFIREDQMIRYVNEIDFGYSGPRVMTMINFLVDLGLLDDKDGTMTKRGEEYYNNLLP